jgi:hypothetical protein
MQLTKQQKLVGAVLVLAVVAFVVDRWVIGNDEDLAVTPSAAPHAPAARRPVTWQPKAIAAAPEASLGNLAGLATRLGSIARRDSLDADTVRDAFRPPASWVGATRTATPDEMAVAAREFQNRRLTAVIMKGSGRGVAIVDQRMVGVGQTLDGFVLVTVKERSAVFRRGTQRVELRLADDLPGATSEKVAGVDTSR